MLTCRHLLEPAPSCLDVVTCCASAEHCVITFITNARCVLGNTILLWQTFSAACHWDRCDKDYKKYLTCYCRGWGVGRGVVPSDILCQCWLLDVKVQEQLEEINPESESDGPDGKAGKMPSVIHTALTCCSVSGGADCANTPNSVSRPSDPNTMRHTFRDWVLGQQMAGGGLKHIRSCMC